MTPDPKGEIKAAFPATTKGAYGLVRRIAIEPNAAATGIVTVQCQGITIKQFNPPAATGPMDHPFVVEAERDQIDPTQYSIVPDSGAHGAWVCYWAS